MSKVRLRRLLRRVKRVGHPDEPLLSVYRDHGVVPKDSRDDNFNRASEDLSGYQLVCVGDLAINKMKAWQGSLAVSPHRGIVSPAYHIYEVNGSAVDGAFLHHLLRSPPMIARWHASSKGIRPNQWDLEPDAFLDTRIELPPLDEQRAIASFLDKEAAQIDALIAAKRRQLTFLEERRQTAVRSIFLGLDDGARLIATGNEYVPHIGGTWQLTKLKHVVGDIIDTEHKTAPSDPNGAAMIVKTSNVRNGRLITDGAEWANEETYAEWTRRGAPRPGDVIFTREAPAGEACVIPETPRVLIGQRTVLIRPHPEKMDARLVAAYLESPIVRLFIDLHSLGSTVAHLNMADIPNIPVPLIPPAQQSSILAKLNRNSVQARAAQVKISESIEKLIQRRQALITHAVTGQLKVPMEAVHA